MSVHIKQDEIRENIRTMDKETGCNNEVSLSGVQICILLGVGGVKTQHGPHLLIRSN